jgi:glutaredoxin-related protein
MLFVNGELVGGHDIIKEMHQQGTLKETLPADPLDARLKALINRKDVMLFMKGV